MFRPWCFAAAVAAALSPLFLVLIGVSVVNGADIKVLSAGALEPPLNDLLPQFERSSGHKVTIIYETVGALMSRLQRDEPADVAIVSGQQNEDLQKQGKIVVGSRHDIAKVGLGVGVRKGAPKPDISSVDSFKGALLAAKSIAYGDPAGGASSDIYIVKLFDRLGIAAEMRPKTKIFPLTAYGLQSPVLEVVAKGQVEMGFRQASVIMAAQDLDFVGPLPAAIQSYTLFAAGLVASSKHQDAGKALIQFISSPRRGNHEVKGL
jgi:molybdate transport system substrate-binding protein